MYKKTCKNKKIKEKQLNFGIFREFDEYNRLNGR